MRPVEDHLAGHHPGAVNVPVSGTSFATKAGFVLDAERAVTVLATTEDEALRAIRQACARSPSSRSPATCSAAATSVPRRSRSTSSRRLLAAGAEVIDVREKDERDTGYIPGSRNIPYRLLPICGADLPTDRPLVTMCESGHAAAIAASILVAKGYDARPVLDGGIATGAPAAATPSSSGAAAAPEPLGPGSPRHSRLGRSAAATV